MLPEKLAALPVGTILVMDGCEGEILREGAVTHIMWIDDGYWTVFVDTKSKVWEKYISEIEVIE
jgi:hypothetical protein